jgi:PAS domain S-box-containing protein
MDPSAARSDATRLRAHYELVRVLTEAASLDEATPRLLELIGNSFGWQLGILWMVDPEADALRPAADWVARRVDVVDFAAAMRAVTFARGVGLPGRVWARGEPAWVADLKRDPNFPRADAAMRSGLRAGVGLPVYGREGVLGVMEFFGPAARVPDPDQLDLMRTVGRQVGQFVERKHAEELLKGSEELKSAIIDASLDCVITMDHTGAIADFNPAAVETFGFAREQAVGADLAGLIIPSSLREAHRAALSRYLETGEGAMLGRRIELTGLRAGGEEFPLELTITRIGDSDPPLFAGFVRDITERRRSAVELAQLLEAEREARVRAEAAEQHASQLAATLQQSLLPPRLPDIPGFDVAATYRAGGEGVDVGGDFYDVFETADGAWGVAVGDVCGKGAEAAAITALARNTIRTAARYESEPSQVLRRLNEALLQREGEGSFCTVAYAVVQTPSHGRAALRLALGGHPSPLVVRAGGRVEALGRVGTMLGAVEEAQIEDADAELANDDLLVLYTDGITECQTPEGRFGSERLAALLGGLTGQDAASVTRRVAAAVVEETGHRSADDVAVLVLRASTTLE